MYLIIIIRLNGTSQGGGKTVRNSSKAKHNAKNTEIRYNILEPIFIATRHLSPYNMQFLPQIKKNHKTADACSYCMDSLLMSDIAVL